MIFPPRITIIQSYCVESNSLHTMPYMKINPLHLPSSPPGIEKSRGRRDHFCIFWALEMALSLALSMPCCMAFKTMASLWSKMSDTLVAPLPWAFTQSTVTAVMLSVGSIVSILTSTYSKWTVALWKVCDRLEWVPC